MTTICPPSGWVNPCNVFPWVTTPTPTPVPTVIYTSDYLHLCCPNLNSAKAAALTSVYITKSLARMQFFKVLSNYMFLQLTLGVDVIEPYFLEDSSRLSGPNEAIPTKSNPKILSG